MNGGLRIAAVRLLCPEPERTARFFQAAFDCRREENRTFALRLGDQRIEFGRAAHADRGLAPSNATGFHHLAIVVADMAAAVSRLDDVPGWTAISRAGPETLPASSGGVAAFKFRDPDGHPLEFLAFPADRVPPTWRGRTGLFLGIDHTAITVADTARSIAFYEALGFAVAGRSLNTGAEQARLDGLDDPIVEVTGLALPGATPHLELLCYLEPGVIDAPAADGGPLATEIVLAGPGRTKRSSPDPDGHRLVWRDDEPP